MFKQFELVEDELFTAQLTDLGDVERVDEAIASLLRLISLRPDVFPLVPNTRKLRLAKSDRFIWIGGVVPRLRLWFSIEDDDHVLLRAIEIEPEEQIYGEI